MTDITNNLPLSVFELTTSEERVQAELSTGNVEINANGLIHVIDGNGDSIAFSLTDLEALIQHARKNVKFDPKPSLTMGDIVDMIKDTGDFTIVDDQNDFIEIRAIPASFDEDKDSNDSIPDDVEQFLRQHNQPWANVEIVLYIDRMHKSLKFEASLIGEEDTKFSAFPILPKMLLNKLAIENAVKTNHEGSVYDNNLINSWVVDTLMKPMTKMNRIIKEIRKRRA
tara:strand:+ start:3567 stop:4244 length:678 start_codon:yes stop_codon:yes gene_type:complete